MCLSEVKLHCFPDVVEEDAEMKQMSLVHVCVQSVLLLCGSECGEKFKKFRFQPVSTC